jgi:hypothetical protein
MPDLDPWNESNDMEKQMRSIVLSTQSDLLEDSYNKIILIFSGFGCHLLSDQMYRDFLV